MKIQLTPIVLVLMFLFCVGQWAEFKEEKRKERIKTGVERARLAYEVLGIEIEPELAYHLETSLVATDITFSPENVKFFGVD